MKRLRRLLAAVAALALTATLLALGTSPAAAAPAQAAPKGYGTCKATAPGSQARRQGTGWTCADAVPVAAPATATARTVRGVSDGACANGRDSDRHNYCWSERFTIWAFDTSGKEIGHAVVVAASFARLSSSSGKWTENIAVKATEMEGEAKTVSMDLSATCSGLCTVDAPAWGGAPVELALGDEKTGNLSFTSTVTNGNYSFISPTYTSFGEILDVPGSPANPVTWNGHELRCDAQIGQTPGCIVMGHLANVTIRESAYGAAAIAYGWAQSNLKGGNFGTKTRPLQRNSGGKTEAAKKRRQSCTAAPDPFKKDPSVPDDSCDEFPFASSVQGGTNGSECTEIIPRKTAGVWRVDVVRASPHGDNAPCIRAHVPLPENRGAGGELGRAVVADRILEKEWYEVIIAP
ncbi:hypothetical protein ADL22_11065 [Streptomyces sp. NRRL F-4489]|uniref:NucA/NucB deoxyribonuclease domain-containing protein n=1 Tax=Streptomyces sp. NRRL F-4489 TaxID=1609095 RepID=UPI0007479518|nr:hypothetical protein [Streptomyces sp. NRRL F-4489]KUL46048.1 hypothetical protein ADL22_11065 [Streptomyces sp. NRRL F-4489]